MRAVAWLRNNYLGGDLECMMGIDSKVKSKNSKQNRLLFNSSNLAFYF